MTSPNPQIKKHANSLSEEEIRRIKKDYEQGTPVREIALRHRRARSTITRYAKSRGWERPNVEKNPASACVDEPQNPDEAIFPVGIDCALIILDEFRGRLKQIKADREHIERETEKAKGDKGRLDELTADRKASNDIFLKFPNAFRATVTTAVLLIHEGKEIMKDMEAEEHPMDALAKSIEEARKQLSDIEKDKK